VGNNEEEKGEQPPSESSEREDKPVANSTKPADPGKKEPEPPKVIIMSESAELRRKSKEGVEFESETRKEGADQPSEPKKDKPDDSN
jgi:hypothetical protein